MATDTDVAAASPAVAEPEAEKAEGATEERAAARRSSERSRSRSPKRDDDNNNTSRGRFVEERPKREAEQKREPEPRKFEWRAPHANQTDAALAMALRFVCILTGREPERPRVEKQDRHRPSDFSRRREPERDHPRRREHDGPTDRDRYGRPGQRPTATPSGSRQGEPMPERRFAWGHDDRWNPRGSARPIEGNADKVDRWVRDKFEPAPNDQKADDARRNAFANFKF